MPFREIEGHFSKLPNINIRRSKMDLNHTVSFTGNVGDLIPFFVMEVLPGDTFKIETSKIIRLSTSIHPTMDNLYLDTYYFYVPNRLVWKNWAHFMGESDVAWTDSTVYVPPYTQIGNGTSSAQGGTGYVTKVEPGSLLNYLGIPNFSSGKSTVKATLLDTNAYIKIWNDWFRDENLQSSAPLFEADGIHTTTTINALKSWMNTTFGINVNFGEADSCFKVARFHDIFSSCLPQPQKGGDVLIPATADVVTDFTASAPLWKRDANTNMYSDTAKFDTGRIISGTWTNYPGYLDPNGSLKMGNFQMTVNSLRLAMQTQKLLERDARGGSRYVELCKSHFGVDSPDARLQRSEYLGGSRTLLNMSEVLQTSETTSNSPLGNIAGRSSTADVEGSFTKSFVEHGQIIGVCCVRTDKTYSQGLERRYSRFNKLDYYYPVLANIGEQPIFKRELFISATANAAVNNQVFGYQEAWAEYRYKPNRVCGYFDPSVSGSIASWNYADGYSAAPTLSSMWLMQGRSEVDRTLAVQSSVMHQLLFNFYVHGSMVRPMPVYSIPGLVDHN